MSLDLSVITDRKVADRLLKSVNDFLRANGFYKDKYGYRAASDTISLDIFLEIEPEKADFWSDGLPKVVWFMPLTEIALESRHTRESHKMNYRIAKKLAKLIGGVIYDHQVDVVYGSSGRPCDHYRTDEKFEKYGAGTNLFMGAIGMVEGILKSK